MRALLVQNEYLPLQPFCSSEFDFVSTDAWLKKLKTNKTLTAQRFDTTTLRFEEAILIDEEVKKETENDKTLQKHKSKENKEEVGFWYKADVGYVLLSRWQVFFPGENLERWMQKVVKACELRRLMDNLLRFNYYVDNMPLDDLSGLETQIQTAVLDKVAYSFDKSQIDPLMEEMNISFTKLQN